MFEYSSKKRITAAEALKHPFFTSEEPLMEAEAPKQEKRQALRKSRLASCTCM